MKKIKYELMKGIRKALLIKWENTILVFLIPLLINQIIKAQGGFKIASVLMILSLFFAVWYGIRETRREAFLEVKQIEKELKKELEFSCNKKRSYSSKRKIFIDQNYNHSFLFSR